MQARLPLHHQGPSWSWSYGSFDLQLPLQSVPITTNVVSSNPVHIKVYLIQQYVIKFLSDLRQVCGFLRILQGSLNQAKWATSSPWFQWNHSISVKKRSFSRPVSLFKSVFFSPIIILFLQYSLKRSSHVPEIWPIQGLMFNILFQTR